MIAMRYIYKGTVNYCTTRLHNGASNSEMSKNISFRLAFCAKGFRQAGGGRQLEGSPSEGEGPVSLLVFNKPREEPYPPLPHAQLLPAQKRVKLRWSDLGKLSVDFIQTRAIITFEEI